MAETGIYVTPEGIERKLPEYWTNRNRRNAGKLNSISGSEFAELELALATLPDGTPNYNVDRDGDGTNDGFLSNDNYIPAYATIIATRVFVRKAVAGGTSISVGVFQTDGTEVDADGLVSGATTAEMDTIGNLVVGAGALVGQSVGDKPVTLGVTGTGDFTAGEVQIMVEYSLNSQTPVGTRADEV